MIRDKIQIMEITLNLPENVYQNFTRLAEKKHRRIEDVIADKLQNDLSTDEPTETLSGWPDEDIVALANLKLPVEQADRMSRLLDRQQSGLITNVEKSELEMYVEIYNNANLRKAQGIVESVKRGLISSTNDLK